MGCVTTLEEEESVPFEVVDVACEEFVMDSANWNKCKTRGVLGAIQKFIILITFSKHVEGFSSSAVSNLAIIISKSHNMF